MPVEPAASTRAAVYVLLAAAGGLAIALGFSLVGDVYQHQNGCQAADGQRPALDVCRYVGLRVSHRSWWVLGGFLASLVAVLVLALRRRPA